MSHHILCGHGNDIWHMKELASANLTGENACNLILCMEIISSGDTERDDFKSLTGIRTNFYLKEAH